MGLASGLVSGARGAEILTLVNCDRRSDRGAVAGGAGGLGYMGVDVVLYRVAGPQVLEQNAQPGPAH